MYWYVGHKGCTKIGQDKGNNTIALYVPSTDQYVLGAYHWSRFQVLSTQRANNPSKTSTLMLNVHKKKDQIMKLSTIDLKE